MLHRRSSRNIQITQKRKESRYRWSKVSILKWTTFRSVRSCSPDTMGSLSKDHVEDSENVIWKCNFEFLQSNPNYYVILLAKCILSILELHWKLQWYEKHNNENLWSGAQIVHTMAKQLVLSRRKDEVRAVLKRAKMLFQSVQNHFFFSRQICKLMTILSPPS
mgnify:FL=1